MEHLSGNKNVSLYKRHFHRWHLSCHLRDGFTDHPWSAQI